MTAETEAVGKAYQELFAVSRRVLAGNNGDRKILVTDFGAGKLRAQLLGEDTLLVVRTTSPPSQFLIDTIFDATHPPKSFSDPEMILRIAQAIAAAQN